MAVRSITVALVAALTVVACAGDDSSGAIADRSTTTLVTTTATSGPRPAPDEAVSTSATTTPDAASDPADEAVGGAAAPDDATRLALAHLHEDWDDVVDAVGEDVFIGLFDIACQTISDGDTADAPPDIPAATIRAAIPSHPEVPDFERVATIAVGSYLLFGGCGDTFYGQRVRGVLAGTD